MNEGIVVRIEGAVARVRTPETTVRATLRGVLKAGPRASAHPIAVGDRVQLIDDPKGDRRIEKVLERKNLLARADPGDVRRYQPIAANLDQVLCMQAFRDPPLNLRGLERFLLLAHATGVPAAIAVNKLDLQPRETPHELDHYPSIGVPLFRISATHRTGLEALAPWLADRTTVIVGPSGVGKTTLLNALVPGLQLRTGSVSRATSKGVHTTVRVEWIDLPGGGVILDTPGLRAIRPWGIDPENLILGYPEFADQGRCRFPDCAHRKEPDCAVRSAVEQGKIPAFRYDSYLRILAALQEESSDW